MYMLTDSFYGKAFICFIIFFNKALSSVSPIPAYLPKSFDECMVLSSKYNPGIASNQRDWKLITLFYNNFITGKSYNSKEYIPKKIHQIWLGSPFPSKYTAWQETWKKFHPDWEYFLWTDADIEKFGLYNKDMYDAAKNYGQKSDIARYEILYRIGGLYIDTDFECFKSFDLLHHCCDFYAGVAYGSTAIILYNGLIGSRAKHPILKECIESLKAQKKNVDPYAHILHKTGPFHFTRAYKKHIATSGGAPLLLPVTYLYPWPEYMRREKDNLHLWLKPESFAMHHWEVSWKENAHINFARH